MYYEDGTEIALGDVVLHKDGLRGEVVALLDKDAYSADYPKSEWSYLKSGVLVLTTSAGVVHYQTGHGKEFSQGV